MIITKSVTRFARNTVDSIQTIRELKNLGIAVYFEKERVNTLSEKSEQLLTILSSIAQGESESISTNSRWSVRYRFQNGTFIIAAPAYGYTNDENGELIIQEREAVIVRRIFSEYLKGKGFYSIARELQEEGIPTMRGAKEWKDSVVKGILQNPVYEGDLLLQKTYTTDGIPFRKRHNHGEFPQYLITDNHESIITREEAYTVREIYQYRRQIQCTEDYSLYQNRYLFSGRIVCGGCGVVFRRKKIHIGKPYEKIQWSCYQHIKDIAKCGQKPVSEETIKEAFICMWNRMNGHYEEILRPLLTVLKAVPQDPELEQEYLDLEQEIRELKQQSYMLQKILMDGSMGSAVFIERRNQISSRIESASRRQQQMKRQKLYEQEIKQTEYLLSVFESHSGFLEEFDGERFLMIVKRIIVMPGQRLVFQLKNGLKLEEPYGKKG